MVVVLSKSLDLEKIVSTIKETGFPCFDMEMSRREVEENKSFFVYSDDGDLVPGANANQFKKSFLLMFVTREGATVDVLELVERLRLCRLLFDGSEVDKGSVSNSDESATATTMRFHHVIKIER